MQPAWRIGFVDGFVCVLLWHGPIDVLPVLAVGSIAEFGTISPWSPRLITEGLAPIGISSESMTRKGPLGHWTIDCIFR